MVRLILTSRALQILLVLGALLAIAGPLFLLKIWTVSPPGFKPVIRISLLDRVQAWSLRRNALAAEARGDFDNARSAWRAAVGNNRADVGNLRSTLAVILKTAEPAESANLALSLGASLVQLGQTNAADLELVCTVWNRCDLHERTLLLLSRHPAVTSAPLNRARLVSLFRGEAMSAFTNLLDTEAILKREVEGLLEPGREFGDTYSPETEFAAIGLGYLAGWGPAEVRPAAMARLQEMAKRPRLEHLSYEVQMAVYLQLGDVPACETALRQIESTGRATLAHQTAYWRLLAFQARKPEAVKLALDANPVPKTDGEVLRLVATYSQLGMLEEAEQLCRRYLDELPWLEQSAWMRARLLIRMERWSDLRQLAYKLKSYPLLQEALGGTSAFLEGLAEWQEGYKDNARRSFEEAARIGFNNPRLALEVGDTLLARGEAKIAELVLLHEPVRKALASDRLYLTSLVKCAYYLRSTAYLGETVTALYRLSPGDPLVMNNYAATLLLLRTNVEQALIHTLRLAKMYPNRPEMQVNHASALVMNGRLEEADQVLGEVSPIQMTSEGAQVQFYMALFELRLRQGRKLEAQAALREVKTSDLYPIQVEWIEKTALPELEALPDQPVPGGN